MATQASRILTLGTLLVSSLSVGAVAQTANNRVLIIDEGVDLRHTEFSGKTFFNSREKFGQSGRDDDNNGFTDDVSGWNAISQDSEYFPAWVTQMFEDNSATISKIFSLYNRIEEGDPTAIDVIRKNPSLGEALGTVLGLSHGTHVGGIVVRYGNSAAEIASINVFTSSQAPEKSPNDGEGPNSLAFNKRFSLGKPMLRVSRLLNDSLQTPNNDATGTTTAPFSSRFDDTNGVNDFLAQLRSEEMEEKRVLANYVATVRPRVANLSLGASKISVRSALDSMWAEDLNKAGLPLSTPRNATQERNYQRLLSEIFEIFRGSWNQFFRANTSTLFVVAAGNDASDMDTPNAGNNGINEVLPANCSKDNSNVITIAATTPEGVIADFSNYHSSLVNVAAWGTAVPSLAPNQNTVKMSGTSMAAPNAAGVASKIFSVNQNLSAAQTRQIMEGTVKKIAALKGRVSSEGMIDPQAALDAARRAGSLLVNGNVTLAVRDAVLARDRAQSARILTTTDIFSADKTRVGQVHRTPAMVKAFLR